MIEKKLIDVMPTLLTDGAIFNFLPNYGSSTPLQMGITYALQHSGQKYVNSFVKNYLDNTGVLTNDGIETIGNVLNLIYKENWDRMYEIYTKEYDPFINYDITVTETRTKTGTDTTDIIQGQQIITDNLGATKETQNIGATNETHNIGAINSSDVYGNKSITENLGNKKSTVTDKRNAFNSGMTDTDQTITTDDTITNTTTENGRTDTHNEQSRTDSISEDAKLNTISNDAIENSKTIGEKTDQDKTTYNTEDKLERNEKGDNSVRPPQTVIKEEIELRQYNFFEQIFSDIDKYICLAVY